MYCTERSKVTSQDTRKKYKLIRQCKESLYFNKKMGGAVVGALGCWF